jgi:hypothetical protein
VLFPLWPHGGAAESRWFYTVQVRSHPKLRWSQAGLLVPDDLIKITMFILNLISASIVLCLIASSCLSIIIFLWMLLSLFLLSSIYLFIFASFFLFCCDGCGYIVAFTKVLTMYQLFHTWIHPFLHSGVSPTPPIHGTVSTGTIFAFTCMCTHILNHIYSPKPLSLPSLPSSCFYGSRNGKWSMIWPRFGWLSNNYDSQPSLSNL